MDGRGAVRIYVSADMEGVGGIVLREQVRRGEVFYDEGRRLFTCEVNAVTDALFACGADQVIVKDGHGGGLNLMLEEVDERALYAVGATPMERRFPGLDGGFAGLDVGVAPGPDDGAATRLDDGFAGACLVGYHGMAGTLFAVRAHTYAPTEWQAVELNGRPVGEIVIDALLFGLRGVPVLFVSGDEAACREAAAYLPHAVTLVTKWGTGQHAALIKPPKAVRAEMGAAIASAMARAAVAQPLVWPGPYELRIRFAEPALADARHYDGVAAERIDGVTAVYRGADLLDVLSRAL